MSNWRNKAICADSPDLAKAFGDDLDEDEPYSTLDALFFIDNHCLNCPVMVQCGEWVKDNPQEYGVYGGWLPADRNPREDSLETASA